MSRADLDKWEARYAKDGLEPGEPDPFVLRAVEGLPPGRALDVAGGLGRHAIALAERGWQVTLLDVSPRGLAAATAAARGPGVHLATRVADLDEAPLPEGPFDLVLVAWFLLPDARWAELPARIRPGGHLLYVQPTVENLERHPRPSRRFLVDLEALLRRSRDLGLTVIRHEVGWDGRENHTERILAQR